jgi:hypothetical protein
MERSCVSGCHLDRPLRYCDVGEWVIYAHEPEHAGQIHRSITTCSGQSSISDTLQGCPPGTNRNSVVISNSISMEGQGTTLSMVQPSRRQTRARNTLSHQVGDKVIIHLQASLPGPRTSGIAWHKGRELVSRFVFIWYFGAVLDVSVSIWLPKARI